MRNALNRRLVFIVCTFWVATFCLLFFTPQAVEAHSINGTLTGRYTAKVERYRPLVTKYLKRYGEWTRERQGRILNTIKHESGGSPHAHNGRHAGLVQFTPCWKHNYSRAYFKRKHLSGYHTDNRLSASWSIRRICQVFKVGGTAKVKQHWRATYWR